MQSSRTGLAQRDRFQKSYCDLAQNPFASVGPIHIACTEGDQKSWHTLVAPLLWSTGDRRNDP